MFGKPEITPGHLIQEIASLLSWVALLSTFVLR